MKVRDHLLKLALKSGLTIDRQKFTSARNKVTQTLRKAKADFFMTIIESAKGNGRKIWHNINKLTCKQTKKDKELELNINNKLVKDSDILATELNNYFIDSVNEISQLFNPPDYNYIPINHSQPIFRIEEISEIEVDNIIRSLNSSKAKDIYDLDTNFLKAHKDALIPPITHLVNQSIKLSVVPPAWKIGVVSPIFKAGDKTDKNNYRPITILPIVSKILEKWVVKLLTEHLNEGHTPLHPMQFGFRAHHSTESAITIFFRENQKLSG